MGTIRALYLGLAVVAIAGCSRSKEPEPEIAQPVAHPPAAHPSAPRPPASVASLSSRYSRPGPEHLVAIGDLHGDLDVTRRALRLAGAIDANDRWAGGSLVLVQTGDEIDRGDDDRKIMDLFERLKVEAKAAGGEVLALSGNHEIMNALLDFRYVTPGAFTSFGDLSAQGTSSSSLARLEEPARGRAAAFLPGGRYSAHVATRPLIVKVGDSVFVHGGVLPKHVRYGLDRINDEVHDWLVGKRPDCPAVVTSEDGPVWTRMYSAATGNEECAILREALDAMGAKRMVVGHTVQRNGINSACDGRVWRIDTGLAKFFGGKLEVLDVRGDAVTVRRVEPDAGH
jgi:hypothetical protein